MGSVICGVTCDLGDGMTYGDYHGLRTITIENEHLRVECLADAGPRVVRLCLAGSDANLLAELPRLHWTTPYGEYYPRGGHRLWHAPESFPRTCVPDDGGVSVEFSPGAASLAGPVEQASGIRKRIDLRLLPGRPAVQLTHTLRNDGLWTVELAPWAITQLPLGGAAILPQGRPEVEPGLLLPDRSLALWPYSRWDDPRLRLSAEHVLVLGSAGLPPLKAGCMVRAGWVAYLNGPLLFVKRFQPQQGRPHADLNCNAEVYCNGGFVELETLGPLARLEPGGEVSHVETWEIYATPDALGDLAAAVEAASSIPSGSIVPAASTAPTSSAGLHPSDEETSSCATVTSTTTLANT